MLLVWIWRWACLPCASWLHNQCVQANVPCKWPGSRGGWTRKCRIRMQVACQKVDLSSWRWHAVRRWGMMLDRRHGSRRSQAEEELSEKSKFKCRKISKPNREPDQSLAVFWCCRFPSSRRQQAWCSCWSRLFCPPQPCCCQRHSCHFSSLLLPFCLPGEDDRAAGSSLILADDWTSWLLGAWSCGAVVSIDFDVMNWMKTRSFYTKTLECQSKM